MNHTPRQRNVFLRLFMLFSRESHLLV